MRIDREDLATFYFEKALDLDNGNEEALYSLGVSYVELGKCDKAIVAFSRASSLNEHYWQAWEGLGHAYGDCKKNIDEAQKYFNKSKEIRENLSAEPI